MTMEERICWLGRLFFTCMLLLAGCTTSPFVPHAVTAVPVPLLVTAMGEAESVAMAKATIDAALNNPMPAAPDVQAGTPDVEATRTKLRAEQTVVASTLTALAPTVPPTVTPDPAAAAAAVDNQMATAIAATLTANAPPSTSNLAATQTAAAHTIATAVQATMMAKPTVTPTSTRTPTARPTNTGTPTPLSMIFHPISLSSIANASTQEGYVDPPLGSRELHGILFDLPRGQNSVTTQAEPLPSYPTVLVLPNLDIRLPEAVYLLITGGNTRVQFEGAQIGIVDLIFSNNQHVTEALIPGRNLREWKIYGDHNVTWTTAANIIEVWQTPNSHDSGVGIIDLLTITIPPPLREQTLREIRIYDQSQETVNSMDPAINLLGVTVLGQE